MPWLLDVGRALVEAVEAPAPAAPPGRSARGHGAWAALRGVASVAGPLLNAAAHSVERKTKQTAMPRATADVLLLGLLATRLSEAAYLHSSHVLSAALSDVPSEEACELALLRFSPQSDHTGESAQQLPVSGAATPFSSAATPFSNADTPSSTPQTACRSGTWRVTVAARTARPASSSSSAAPSRSTMCSATCW